MTVHKKTRLLPDQRKELADDYYKGHVQVCDLVRKYRVTAPTVYKILHRSRNNEHSIHKSVIKRFRCLEYGLKRLSKIERALEEKLKKQSKRYNKKYPGEMMHFDTKRLPLLKGESPKLNNEYLFVAVDDFSRELYIAIFSDKTQYSSESFLTQVLDECPYTIEIAYSDNGLAFKGIPEHHAFAKLCRANKIEQRFTKLRRPQTDGKAKRVIRHHGDVA